MPSLEPQMSGVFNEIGLPPSLKAFTTGFQPGSSGSIQTTSGVEMILPSTSFAEISRQGFELPSIGNTSIEAGSNNGKNQLTLEQEPIPISTQFNVNDLQLKPSHMREAGSGSSTPSVTPAASISNSIYHATSVDSQLALLRNEMVRDWFFFD